MTGTFINVATVLLGGLLGLVIGSKFPDKMRTTIVAGLGLFTAAIGLNMFMASNNVIIVLVSLLIGAVLGEWWDIEAVLQRFGGWLHARFASQSEGGNARFVNGFLTASLLFCVGPLTIVGSIQDGLTADYSLLAIKSVLDGFAALVFASTLGIGVLFSALVILIYQGGLSLLASQAQTIFTEPMIAELTSVGGILLIGIALSSLLEIKTIRVGNFLPALFIAPAIVKLLAWFTAL